MLINPYRFSTLDAVATGGAVTDDDDNIYHTFSSDGNLIVHETVDVKILLVGGGGGGGDGASGVIYNMPGGGAEMRVIAKTLSPGTYPIVIGAGGTGGASPVAGGTTSFDLDEANGGEPAIRSPTWRSGNSGTGLLGGWRSGTAAGSGAGHSEKGLGTTTLAMLVGGLGELAFDGLIYGTGGRGRHVGVPSHAAGWGNPGSGGEQAGAGYPGLVVVSYLKPNPSGPITGGVVTTPGDGYAYHAFTRHDALYVHQSIDLDCLVVGGGGGSGGGAHNAWYAVGAGGGEVIEELAKTFAPGVYAAIAGAGTTSFDIGSTEGRPGRPSHLDTVGTANGGGPGTATGEGGTSGSGNLGGARSGGNGSGGGGGDGSAGSTIHAGNGSLAFDGNYYAPGGRGRNSSVFGNVGLGNGNAGTGGSGGVNGVRGLVLVRYEL
jgi:hypothetical protein